MSRNPQDWPHAVVFDLDGTLIDSAPDIAHALNRAIVTRDLTPFPIEKVKEMIGGGVPKLIERALTARGASQIDVPSVAADFVRLYRERLTTLTTLYEGARDLLERLCYEGRRLGLCTNKQHELTIEILDELDLAKYFSSVIGEREGSPRKPDPAPLREVLASLGVAPDNAVMVGDSSADIECARAAGVSAVAVSFGYSHAAPQSLGADAVIDRLADLPGCFSALEPHTEAK
jgi:phosphoglycolate phosphatase